MPKQHFCKIRGLIMTSGALVATIFLVFLFANTFSEPVPASSAEEEKTDLSTLELLHVVFRHGPRTPADTYPTDPHVNETFAPFGWGHVTNNGKRELFNMGTWLRKRYGEFLKPHYSPDLVHAQATGVHRTHMSMQTVLASFFPPKGTAMEWNSKYNWQPIPVFSQALNEDTLLLVRTSCPRYHEAFLEVFKMPEVVAEIEPHKYLYEELTKLTGMPIKEPEDVQSLYLTLLAEQEFGLELPEWTKDYFPEKLQYLTEQSYLYNAYTPEMQRIKAGPFLKKMFTEMKEKSEHKLSPKERKLFIYTGHDTTVVNILNALKVWQRQLPRYSIMTIFELHKNPESGEHYVEIYLRNNQTAPADKLTVPGCDFQCPLDKLIKLSEEVTRSEADPNVCESKSSGFTEPPLRGP